MLHGHYLLSEIDLAISWSFLFDSSWQFPPFYESALSVKAYLVLLYTVKYYAIGSSSKYSESGVNSLG